MPPLLGLDYGLRRIGIAISDEDQTLASALHTHRTDRDGSIFSYLQRLVDERGAAGFVIGLPLTGLGEEGAMALRVREFASKLFRKLGLPVHLVDERFSSQEAGRFLSLGGRRRRSREERDAVAAEIILQQFLDGQQAAPSGPETS